MELFQCPDLGARTLTKADRGVLAPKEVDEDESAKMFAAAESPDECIGCEACGRTCKKDAFSFETVPA